MNFDWKIRARGAVDDIQNLINLRNTTQPSKPKTKTITAAARRAEEEGRKQEKKSKLAMMTFKAITERKRERESREQTEAAAAL